MSDRLNHAKRVVVKIGSALLVAGDTGRLRRQWLDALIDDIAEAKARGQEFLIVSSGSIALGRHNAGLGRRPLKLEEKQAAAAVGQIQLAHAYQESLARHGLNVAQILLTSNDTELRRPYLNARSTLETLLRIGAVPVINENDTVATEEIRVGDNDRLAARVAQMISADCLVLLSDVDGLFDSDPRRNGQAGRIREIPEITDEILAMAGAETSDYGVGGMRTKLAAARIATSAGCNMAIADGRPHNPLRRLGESDAGSWFVAQKTPRAARKSWISGSLRPTGVLVVDRGAATALAAGKSLLPAGVAEVIGQFERGDAVIVQDEAGRELGRGLCAYSDQDARCISGHKSSEIEALLGYRGRDEMIHRDDLVVN